jgi:putative transcriptional regulator
MFRRALAFSLLLSAAQAAWGDSPFFLVARPELPDPNFQETVVLMPGTGLRGPLGVIVNRPTTIPLSKLFPDIARLEASGDKLFFGGPVGREMVSFAFRADKEPGEDAIEVARGVYLSTDEDLLKKLLRDGSAEVRVFAGFAAWGPEQLDDEIDRGDWHTVPVEARLIFDRRPASVWPELNRRASAIQARWDVAPIARAPLPF